MFYSHDLLCRRNGRFAIIWLLAHAPPRSRPRYISSKEVSAVDIPRACADILLPPAPMSLRFVSALLLGLAQTLGRQATLLYADAQATRSRVVSAPWVAATRSNANAHTLPPSEAVASIHAITLPDALVPEYPNWHVGSEHWIMLSSALHNPRLRACQQFGWLGNVDVHPLQSNSSVVSLSSSPLQATSPSSAVPYTAAWEDISIPDASVRRALPPASINSSPGLLHPLSSSPAQCVPAAAVTPMDNGFINPTDDGEEPSFHFDLEGNLQFAPLVDSDHHSRNLSFDTDPHTQFFGQFTPSHLAMPAPPAPPRRRHSSSAARDELALEAAENDVFCHVDDRPTKRQRTVRRQLVDLGGAAAAGTFVLRVPELWANTCYWHAESQAVLAVRANKDARHHIPRQIQVATTMYSIPDTCNATRLLGPLPAQMRDSPSPMLESDNGWIASYGGDDDDNALELELGRGGSPALNAQFHGDEQYPDIHLDIPWLNPNIFDPARPRQSIGQALSIHTESSPEPAHLQNHKYQQHDASGVSTPASRAPSLDPPSSDDGIEIQPFQLVAHNLEEPEQERSPRSEHGLDSFLDTSRLGHSIADTRQLDKDSSSFRQFTLARMADQGTDVLVFDDLLQHPYRKRRVAARAFTDLLQMATKSVFGVTQCEPFATINITKL
ncbi:R8 protein [Coemansia sp. BCRC 34301]|nr:R8 protein [Coemansia sp. BCRC 34301]